MTDVIHNGIIKISDVRSEFEKSQIGFFRIRSGNRSLADAMNQPIPISLYHNLWFEGELCILFADTGIGKSILAVQIGNEISLHQKVLYVDLELSDKQFENRYSQGYKNHYRFNENFYRVDIPRFRVPEGQTYESYFIECLKKLVEQCNAKIIILDNLTRIVSCDTDRAKDAKPLMDTLNELKFELGVSFLALEHTRKTDNFRPISLNDLQGSKMKSNFCDSAFSIGRSQKDSSIRYIKHLKCRNAEIVYDTDNVWVCEIVKEYSFLHFKSLGFSNEYEHLKDISEVKEDRVQVAVELKRQGKSNVEISKELGVTEGAVRKWLKKAES
jgi:hypothetical protein